MAACSDANTSRRRGTAEHVQAKTLICCQDFTGGKCTTDVNPSSEQNENYFLCVKESVFIEIIFVGVATIKKVYKNRLIVCGCFPWFEILHLI